MNRTRVLLVSPDRDIVAVCSTILEKESFLFWVVSGYDEALEFLEKGFTGVVIADASANETDYPEFFTYISSTIKVPVMVIGHENTADEKVWFLNAGADSYVGQPVNPDELLAEMNALSRRTESGTRNPGISTFASGDIQVDYKHGKVTVKGEVIVMTGREYELLCELTLHVGCVLHYRHLLQAIWGPEYIEEKQYVHVFIHNLRKKIETNPQTPEYIFTIPKVGYIFKHKEKE